MATDRSQQPNGHLVDLTGLPESVVREVNRLVQEARKKQAEEATTSPPAGEGRVSVIGMFEHLGIKTPTLEEFEEARREMRANFPREFPDPSK